MIWSELPEEKEYLKGTFTYSMYNAKNKELLAECSIKEYYLNLIHDGLEGGSPHGENLFNKYVTLIFSNPDKKEVEIHEFTNQKQGLLPDITFFMDVEPEIGLERSLKRGNINKFENSNKLNEILESIYYFLNGPNLISSDVDINFIRNMPIDIQKLLLEKKENIKNIIKIIKNNGLRMRLRIAARLRPPLPRYRKRALRLLQIEARRKDARSTRPRRRHRPRQNLLTGAMT